MRCGQGLSGNGEGVSRGQEWTGTRQGGRGDGGVLGLHSELGFVLVDSGVNDLGMKIRCFLLPTIFIIPT